jgi:hypothetical protein
MQTATTPRMTDAEARKVFDSIIESETCPERRASMEYYREYFTNPEFREWANRFVFELNTRAKR